MSYKFHHNFTFSWCSQVFDTLSSKEKEYLSPKDSVFKNSPYTYYSFGYTKDDTPIAFIQGYVFDDDVDTVIVTVAVRKEDRGNGLAKKMLKRLINQSAEDKMKKIVYRVDKDNHSSIKLIESVKSEKVKTDDKNFTYEIKPYKMKKTIKENNIKTIDDILMSCQNMRSMIIESKTPTETLQVINAALKRLKFKPIRKISSDPKDKREDMCLGAYVQAQEELEHKFGYDLPTGELRIWSTDSEKTIEARHLQDDIMNFGAAVILGTATEEELKAKKKKFNELQREILASQEHKDAIEQLIAATVEKLRIHVPR